MKDHNAKRDGRQALAKQCSMPREALTEASRALKAVGVEPSADDSITLASWNVNRIPLAREGQNYRDDRNICMSEILQEFDVAALSERFLSLPPINGHDYASENITNDRINWLTFNSKHHGLTLSSGVPMTIEAEAHYRSCSPNRADCRVRKGFLISEVTTPRGAVIIVTTHLDAGRNDRDRTVRTEQLEQLSQALLPYRGQPLVLMGDLNLTSGDPQDALAYDRFMKDHGLSTQLRQSGRGHDVFASRGVDVLNATEYNNPSLTDHPLLAARIRLATAPAASHVTTVQGRR